MVWRKEKIIVRPDGYHEISNDKEPFYLKVKSILQRTPVTGRVQRSRVIERNKFHSEDKNHSREMS
jgi:hypothetical protein